MNALEDFIGLKGPDYEDLWYLTSPITGGHVNRRFSRCSEKTSIYLPWVQKENDGLRVCGYASAVDRG